VLVSAPDDVCLHLPGRRRTLEEAGLRGVPDSRHLATGPVVGDDDLVTERCQFVPHGLNDPPLDDKRVTPPPGFRLVREDFA